MQTFAAHAHPQMLPYLKKGSFLGPKNRRRQPGHLTPGFREKGVFLGTKKPPEAAWEHYTWLLEKQGVFFGSPKPPEAAWAPHAWLLEKKESFCGSKEPPEAAWAPHTWLLEKKESFGGPKNRRRQPGHLTPGF